MHVISQNEKNEKTNICAMIQIQAAIHILVILQTLKFS
jgi:hypothetical protein